MGATWYGSSFTVDLALTDGLSHRVALYMVDWDTNSRAQTVEVLDPSDNTVLASQSVSGFNGGRYLLFDVTGKVRFRFTATAGANAVFSGLFSDPTPYARYGRTSPMPGSLGQGLGHSSFRPGRSRPIEITGG